MPQQLAVEASIGSGKTLAEWIPDRMVLQWSSRTRRSWISPIHKRRWKVNETMGDLNLELLVSWSALALALTAIYGLQSRIKRVPASKFVLAIQVGLTGGIVANPYQSHEMPFIAWWWLMLTPLFWWGVIAINRRRRGDESRPSSWWSYILAVLISIGLGYLVYVGVIDMGWVLMSPATIPN